MKAPIPTAAMFNVNAPLFIAGGTFQQINHADHRIHLTEAFRNHVAQGATHDAAAPGADPPRCHPKTRLAILRRLSMWARNGNQISPSLLWIFGPAGVGKTAIGRSLAEMLAKDDRLAASFFFFRTDAQRNSTDLFVSTLAYQLAFKFPELQPFITEYLRDNPHTAFNLSMETQLEQLIFEPIVRNKEWKHQRLIIVDGLDECHDQDMQSKIILAIGGIAFRLFGKVKFLILSRPEYNIEVTFQCLHSDKYPTRFQSMDLKLDLDAFDDIRISVKDRFDAIKKKHPLRDKIPPCWPDSDDVEELVWRSSGNFIYPQTVMKYIETTRGRPQSRLQVILTLKPTDDRPYGDLDNLYRQILKTVQADINLVLKVLGVVHVLSYETPTHSTGARDKSTECMEAILSLQPGDIELLLLDLRSLIALEEEEIYPTVYSPSSSRIRIPRFLHKSFSDFLLDQARSQEYWVDLSKVRIATLIGIAKLIKQQYLSGMISLFISVLKQEKVDELFTQMVNDEDIAISNITLISACLIQSWYSPYLCQDEYRSLTQSLLEKYYHGQDLLMVNILAILSVVPERAQGVITIMKCIACILLFHPSSNVASSRIDDLVVSYSSPKRGVDHWFTAFTYIQKTANGSVSRALSFMAGAALLPIRTDPSVGIAPFFAYGFFPGFSIAIESLNHQMNEEKLQKATLFCLSHVISRCQDIRNALLNSGDSLRDHLNNTLYLISRLLLVQLYDQCRSYLVHSLYDSAGEWYCLPKRIEVHERALELRKHLISVLKDLERPVNSTSSIRIAQNFITIAHAFIFVSDKNGPVQTGAATNYDSIPCLVRPTNEDIEDSADWTIKPLADILNEEFMYSKPYNLVNVAKIY